MTKPLKNGKHPPTEEAFYRLLRDLKVWKVAFVIAGVVWPIIGAVWIVYEDKRAVDRWQTDAFELRINEYMNANLSARGYGTEADVGRISQAVVELTKEQRELRDTVQRMLGAWETERARRSP